MEMLWSKEDPNSLSYFPSFLKVAHMNHPHLKTGVPADKGQYTVLHLMLLDHSTNYFKCRRIRGQIQKGQSLRI